MLFVALLAFCFGLLFFGVLPLFLGPLLLVTLEVGLEGLAFQPALGSRKLRGNRETSCF